mgnify:CR=1 FL=1
MSIKKIGLVVLGLLCLVWIGATWVRAAPTPTVIRRVIGGGGAHLEEGAYTLDNTIGQPVIGRNRRAGTTLCAGFWCQEIRLQFIYIPLVLRNS